MLDLLARHWWILLIRGILLIAVGLLGVTHPIVTLATLIFFFGAFVFFNGIITLIHALRGWKHAEDRWLPLLDGLLGVWVGTIAFRNPGLTAITLLFFMAIWSLVSGILQLIAAIRLRKDIQGEAWLALGGILSILFALILMWAPGAGALGLLWLISSYAIVFGASLVGVSFKLRGLHSRLA
ncbi:MAG: HdeD family acid-resistance protein [Terriglobia bacterium]